MDNSERSVRPSSSTDVYEDEIDLRDLILVLWKWRKLILAIFLASLLIGIVISFAVTPVYQVQAKISIGSFEPDPKSVQPKITPETAKEMLLSSDLQEEAWGAGADVGVLSVTPVENTNILEITLETNDPQQGEVLLNKLITLFSEKEGVQYKRSKELLNNELQRIDRELQEVNKGIKQTRDLLEKLSSAEPSSTSEIQQMKLLDTLSRFTEQRDKLLEKKLETEQKLNSIEGIKVLEKPEASPSPVRPKKKLNIVVAGVLGLMVGVFAAFMVDYLKRNPLVPSSNGNGTD